MGASRILSRPALAFQASKRLLAQYGRSASARSMNAIPVFMGDYDTRNDSDPLEMLKSSCRSRGLCDEEGFRLPNVHWTFSIAVTQGEDPMLPPSLRTVGVQRISEHGVDFICKRGAASAKMYETGSPVSFVHLQGKYVAGEKAEQWRGEGHCELLPLEDLMEHVPVYTIAGMVASKRLEGESGVTPDDASRTEVVDPSHATEVVQDVFQEFRENGKLSNKEVADCIRAYRFHPDRLELVSGGPDTVIFDRWEWKRSPAGDCPEGTIPWDAPKKLLPH